MNIYLKKLTVMTHHRPLPITPKSGMTRRGEKVPPCRMFLCDREGFRPPTLQSFSDGAVGRFIVILILVLLFLPFRSKAQETFEQTITKTAQFSNSSDSGNKFLVLNINGSVTVEAYDGEIIELTVKEHIEGTDAELARAKRELEFKLDRKGNIIIAWLDAPFAELELEDDGYQYEWDDYGDRDDRDYQFTHTIHVRVPENILAEVSTINGEVVTVTGAFKNVEANNINGDIFLENMTSQTKAETINGDITAKFETAPNEDLTFETTNGTIEVFMPEDLSADIYFESFHGDLFTNFENLRRLEPEVQKNSDSNYATTTYHIDEFSPVRIGGGAVDLRFEVLNGDVYLRKWQHQ